jgi:hypothetical protein
VARDAAADAEELERHGSLLRPHGVVIADWQHSEIGLVDPADELHVAEDAGVSGEVDLLAVLQLEDEAGRLSEVLEIVGARRVEGVREGDFHALLLDRAALVSAFGCVVRKALAGEPVA